MNNPNVNTPYGRQTVDWGAGGTSGGTTPGSAFDQAGYDSAMDAWASSGGTTQSQNSGEDAGFQTFNLAPTGTRPDVNQFMSASTSAPGDYSGDQPTITQTLAPEQQRLLDSQNRISGNLAGVAESGLNRVSQGMQTSFDTSGLPAQTSNVPGGNYASNVGFNPAQNSYGSGGDIQYGTGYNQGINQGFDQGPATRTSSGYNQGIQGQIANAGQQQGAFGDVGGAQRSFDPAGQQQRSFTDVGGPQRGLDFSGAPLLPGVNDFSADRQRVEDSIYSRLNPQFQQDEDALRTRLTNQGLMPGTQAWNTEIDAMNRGKTDARMQAVLAGGGEQSRLFGLGMGARQQAVGETAQQGQFANSAQAQAYNQAMGSGTFANQAQAAQYGQNLGAMQAGNQAQAQDFGQAQARGAFANAAQQNQFGQNQAAGQFANAAQQQGFGQSQAEMASYNAALAQQYSQNQGAAAFGNQAQQQGYAQAQGNAALQNTAQSQANQQNAAQAQFANQGAQQNFGMSQQNAALNNQVSQQQFQQGTANANLTNQARQQQIQEQAYLRSLPLNELNALRNGAQVEVPKFQNYQGSDINPPPIFDAAKAQANYDQGLYGLGVGQANSANSTTASLASAAAMAAMMGF